MYVYRFMFILFRADERAKKGLCTLLCTFFFLRGQKEKVPKKKNPPPKTDLALLRLPMTARQIRFAQTPLESVIGKRSIRSSTGRHVRNGRC